MLSGGGGGRREVLSQGGGRCCPGGREVLSRGEGGVVQGEGGVVWEGVVTFDPGWGEVLLSTPPSGQHLPPDHVTYPMMHLVSHLPPFV